MARFALVRFIELIRSLISRTLQQNLFPVQIENVLSVNHCIEESAVVSVPDDKYGEVVGAWIVRSRSEGGSTLTREAVRNTTIQGMNPQVDSILFRS